MLNEKDYVVNLFNDNFSKHKDKKIVLYGTGPNTKLIIENTVGFNFVGLMDGYKKSGSIYGLDILDYDEVIEKEAEIIIIVARTGSKNIIYNRISEFCKKNNILTLDIYGNDLSIVEEHFTEDNSYFDKNEEELQIQIQSHEVISFDIFDTLMMRKVLYPDDVFEIMGNRINNKKFIALRREAMAKISNANIYEIYDEYQKMTNISDNEKDRLIELEIEIEKSVLIPREKMVQILNYAIGLGKKVYLISDMYFSKEILADILNSLGVKGYSDIFVSCDYKKLKSQGLYKIYKDRVQAPSYLHIGDNKEADYIYPKEYEIDCYNINSAYEMLEISTYSKIIKETKTLSERNMLGLFIAYVFNNPFSLYNSKGRTKVITPYDKGYLFIAPIISAFMIWFINQVKEYDRVIFSARDGYLFSKLYEITQKYIKLPKADYLLTSRVAAVSAGIFNEEDIKYISNYSFGGTPEELLTKRFFLDKEEIEEYKGEELEEYVLYHKDKILKRSKELRDNYLMYLNQFDFNGKVAFFDFVASGTCQFYLEKIIGIKFDGLYFMRLLKDNKELKINSFLENSTEYNKGNYLYDNYIYLEYVIVSLLPSFSHFNNLGEPVYFDEVRTNFNIEYIKEVQKSVIEYYISFLELVNNNINFNFLNILFSFMKSQFTDDNTKEYSVNLEKDEFCNRS